MPVPDGLEDGENLLPGAAHQEEVLGLVQGDDPGVALHRGRALLVLQGHALLAQQVEPFHLHLQSHNVIQNDLSMSCIELDGENWILMTTKQL